MQGPGSGRYGFSSFPDPFANFGGFGAFGGQGSLMSNFFGGRDPFDDPFFRDPFGSMIGPSLADSFGGSFPEFPMSRPLQLPTSNASRGLVIEELNSDGEVEENEDGEEKGNPRKHARIDRKPYVEDPDGEARGNMQCMQYGNSYNMANRMQTQHQPQTHSVCFQSSTVTYGGANGAYYTSSRTKRMGSDGLSIEECKEADTTTRQATHKLSRGIHNKGHSVTRKLNSDGKVDTVQTLHNLNQDELPRFEEAWKGNATTQLPGWSESVNSHRYLGSTSGVQNGRQRALPSTEQSQPTRRNNQDRATRGRGSSSRGRVGSANIVNID